MPKNAIYQYNLFMKTYDIFIDFECICGMFARKLNKSLNQIPLSYTIGYRNNKNEINTIFEIFDFRKNIPVNNNFINFIYEDFAKSIIFNINKLVNKNVPIKSEEINFIGWNPCLEVQLLTSIFKKKIHVTSLIKNCFEESILSTKREVSLSKITKNGYKDKKYFIEFRKEIAKKLDVETITKLNLNHDGSIASYAGFVIYNIIRKTRKTKYHIYMSEDILIKELSEYALDDINRMYYFTDNIKEVKSMLRNIKIVDELKREINSNTKLLSLLEEYNQSLKIKDLVKKLEDKNKKSKNKILLFEV